MRIDEELYALAIELGRASSVRELKIATAESCTGGLVAGAITAVAGSSAWFDRGFVTYSNEAKIEQLGVSQETIAAHGAVSAQTAAEMAAGARRASGAAWAVAVTGVAGPGGGTTDKPVGTVCFGWAGPKGVETETTALAGDRAGDPARVGPDRLGGPDQPAGLDQERAGIERSFYAIIDSYRPPTLQAHHEQRTRQDHWNECYGRQQEQGARCGTRANREAVRQGLDHENG